MRTTFNTNIHVGFIALNNKNIRAKKTRRVKSIVQTSLGDLGFEASIFLNQIEAPKSQTLSSLTHESIKDIDFGKKFSKESEHKKSQSISTQSTIKESYGLNSLPQLTRAESISSPIDKFNNYGLIVPKAEKKIKKTSLSISNTKNLTDQLKENAQHFLSLSKEKHTGKSVEKSEIKSFTQHRSRKSEDLRFSSRTSDLAELDSTERKLSNQETLDLKKSPAKSKLRKIVKPPQSKVDKILAEVTVISRGSASTATCSYEGDRDTSRSTNLLQKVHKSDQTSTNISRPSFVIRDTFKETKTPRLKVSDIKMKLSEYGEIINRQIMSYKHLNLFGELKKNKEIKNNIDQAERTILAKKGEYEKKLELKVKFAKEIFGIVKKMKKLDLNMDNIIRKNALATEPFQRPESVEFIQASKTGNYKTISDLLIFNRFLVYDFDRTKQTALHWATKRGHTKIVKLLLEKGADPDAKDITGRTPLFLAANFSNKICVKLLLLFGANPVIKSDGEKTALDYATEFHIIHLLQRGVKVHGILQNLPWKKAHKMWENLYNREFEVCDKDLV